jgi:hypothetical protein
MADWHKRKRVRNMRRVLREHGSPTPKGGCALMILAVAAILIVMTFGSCGWNDDRNEERGRGDAPVGNIVDEPVDVIQMPDRFSNVAHACDGHGHRVYVTTKSDQSRFMAVIDDAACNTG